MRPVDFTVEQIIEAGQALQSAGRSITGFALRQKVGGGNPSRLKQVWDEHLSSQNVAEYEPVAELPVEVAQQLAQVTEALVGRLNSMAVDINDRAVKASERRVSEVVRAAGEQREQAERELADASQTVDELEQQLDSAQDACNELKQQLAKVQGEKQEQAVELAQVRERLASVEKAARVSADNAAAEVKMLQGQLKEQRGLEQMAREGEARAVGALSAMEKQHLEDAEVCQGLRVELRALSAALAHSEAVSKSRGEDLEQAKGDLKGVRAELKKTSETLVQAQAISDNRGAELEQVKRDLKEVRAELKAANSAESAALAQVKMLEAAAKHPAKTIKPKTDDKAPKQ